MSEITSICVFCGSSEGNDMQITESAETLGAYLAQQEITLVYGAAKIGVMGQVAQACLDHKGKVIGVIPEFLKLKEIDLEVFINLFFIISLITKLVNNNFKVNNL